MRSYLQSVIGHLADNYNYIDKCMNVRGFPLSFLIFVYLFYFTFAICCVFHSEPERLQLVLRLLLDALIARLVFEEALCVCSLVEVFSDLAEVELSPGVLSSLFERLRL